jgi:site-specific DNA-methyltransferase (adenine-specific)
MRSIPDKYFDLCIADPPYGIGVTKMTLGNGKTKVNRGLSDWDSQAPSAELFNEIFRVSKEQIIWGGNYFNLPLSADWIVWDKMMRDMSFAEGELAWCSIHKNLRIFKYQTSRADSGGRIYPTQKPIALYAWLLDKYAKKMGGGKIFDPFLGSGSSRIAAYKMGYDFYACELDEDYYEAQEERFRRECLGEVKTNSGNIITEQSLF